MDGLGFYGVRLLFVDLLLFVDCWEEVWVIFSDVDIGILFMFL